MSGDRKKYHPLNQSFKVSSATSEITREREREREREAGGVRRDLLVFEIMQEIGDFQKIKMSIFCNNIKNKYFNAKRKFEIVEKT